MSTSYEDAIARASVKYASGTGHNIQVMEFKASVSTLCIPTPPRPLKEYPQLNVLELEGADGVHRSAFSFLKTRSVASCSPPLSRQHPVGCVCADVRSTHTSHYAVSRPQTEFQTWRLRHSKSWWLRPSLRTRRPSSTPTRSCG